MAKIAAKIKKPGLLLKILIAGLTAPGMAEFGRGAGKLLLMAIVPACLFTLFPGFFTLGVCGLMIALYIAMDSFGTAANATGDGAIAVIIDKIAK